MSVRLHLEAGPTRVHEHCVEAADGTVGYVGGRYETDSACPYCQAPPTPPLGIPIQPVPPQ